MNIYSQCGHCLTNSLTLSNIVMSHDTSPDKETPKQWQEKQGQGKPTKQQHRGE